MTPARDNAILGLLKETTFGSVADKDDLAKMIGLLTPPLKQ